MKKADLEKFLAKKVEGAMRRENAPDRFGAGSAHVHDRREQRKAEQAAGLVPYAVKLPQALVTSLQALAQSKAVSLNELTAELLQRALGETPSAVSSAGAAVPAKAADAGPLATGTVPAAAKAPSVSSTAPARDTGRTPQPEGTASAPSRPAGKAGARPAGKSAPTGAGKPAPTGAGKPAPKSAGAAISASARTPTKPAAKKSVK